MAPSTEIERLQGRLATHADASKRAWWDRYLKGEAEFRGVPTRAIRSEARAWWADIDADARPADDQVELCLELIRCPMTEDKLAGMLLLGERLIPAGRVVGRSFTTQVESLFTGGHLADWNSVDWFCVRVLGPLIARSGPDLAAAVAAWVDADVMWQRRASLVAFVDLVPDGSYADLVIATADRVVLDQERFAQTGVAWVIRELSTARPDLTGPFLERHHERLSTEAKRQAVKGR